MDKNKFLETFRNKTKDELLEKLDDKKYTPEAVEAAQIILEEKYGEQLDDIQDIEPKEQPKTSEPQIPIEPKINETIDLKLYSQRAIGIATFIGGPLAAGYLVRENFLSLEDPEHGRTSMIFGIISTVLLFTLVFMIPESIIDKVPNQLLPAIYTGIVYLIVERYQGSILKSHKENGNEFYSGWKAAGIGLVSFVIIGVGVLGYIFLSTDDEVYDHYDAQMNIFLQNESESLVFYDDLPSKPNFVLVSELNTEIIPKWKENIQIIEGLNQIESLPLELLERNQVLIKYSELRLSSFELMKKALSEDSDQYTQELEKINSEIDEVLKDLR